MRCIYGAVGFLLLTLGAAEACNVQLGFPDSCYVIRPDGSTIGNPRLYGQAPPIAGPTQFDPTALRNEIQRLEARAAAAERQVDDFRRRVASLESDLQSGRSAPNPLADRVARQVKQISDLEGELRDTQQRIDSERANARAANARFETERDDWRKERVAKEVQVKGLEERNSELNRSVWKQTGSSVSQNSGLALAFGILLFGIAALVKKRLREEENFGVYGKSQIVLERRNYDGLVNLAVGAIVILIYVITGLELKDGIKIAEIPLWYPVFGGVLVAGLMYKFQA
jgi:hypothetical protein